jgi:hypothetical protein
MMQRSNGYHIRGSPVAASKCIEMLSKDLARRSSGLNFVSGLVRYLFLRDSSMSGASPQVWFVFSFITILFSCTIDNLHPFILFVDCSQHESHPKLLLGSKSYVAKLASAEDGLVIPTLE